jgi:hypothetical protein
MAVILLACFSLVFVHATIPHSHQDVETSRQNHQHHHQNSMSHSHSGWADILDFLKDISHSQIGKNHLEEYLNSSKQVIPINTVDFSYDGFPGANLRIVNFHSEVINTRKSLKARFPIFFIDNPLQRGPPFLS